MEMILRETNGALAYVQEMQREARRMAQNRSDKKTRRNLLDDLSTDIISDRICAKLCGRKLNEPVKARWAPMMKEIMEPNGYDIQAKERFLKELKDARNWKKANHA